MNTIMKPPQFFMRLFNLPVILCVMLVLSIVYIDVMDPVFKQFLYSVSLSIKDILVFFIPCIIIAYISSSIIDLGKNASWFVILALICVLCSNFLSTFLAYYVSVFVIQSGNYAAFDPVTLTDTLKPLWKLTLPKLLSNDYALLVGIVWGLCGVYLKSTLLQRMSMELTRGVRFSLNRIFIPMVPVFVAGFIIKLGDEGLLTSLTKDYAPIFLTIFVVQVSYVLFLYLLASKFSLPKFLGYVKNVLPSAVTAFCTMSSAATIPLTLEGAEKNTNNKSLARILIPSTASIHLIGDSIGVPIMCLAILQSFGYGFPSFSEYMIFALQFVLAKFCIAAVPGGGIIVMVPVIETYLGFSPEMAALVSAFYIFFDPINTSVNVTGNGAFAILLSRLNTFIKTIAETLFVRRRPQIKMQ